VYFSFIFGRVLAGGGTLIAVVVVRMGARGAMVREDVLTIAQSWSEGRPLGAERYSAGGVSNGIANGLEV
jgi:hypothetical protein